MIRVGRVLALLVLWVLLWGEISVANVVSGVVVVIGVVVLFPTGEHARRAVVRPVAAAHLAGVVLRELVVSNVALTRDVVSRRPQLRPGLVDCPLVCASPWVGAFVANLLALSPGTLPVAADLDEHVLRLHILRLDDPDAMRRRVTRLESLVVHAFGTRAEVDAVGAR